MPGHLTTGSLTPIYGLLLSVAFKTGLTATRVNSALFFVSFPQVLVKTLKLIQNPTCCQKNTSTGPGELMYFQAYVSFRPGCASCRARWPCLWGRLLVRSGSETG